MEEQLWLQYKCLQVDIRDQPPAKWPRKDDFNIQHLNYKRPTSQPVTLLDEEFHGRAALATMQMSAGRYSLPTPGKVTKMGWLKVGNRASFKKMNIFLMNILDFLKNEYMFWIHILDLKKWIILLYIFFGFSLQKRSLQNVSNSPQNIHGSLVGPNSVHFRLLDPNRDLRRAAKPYFGLFLILNDFPQFLWMNSSIEFSALN